MKKMTLFDIPPKEAEMIIQLFEKLYLRKPTPKEIIETYERRNKQ
jgi:hypothetical protein